jgi:hypothetical protein
MSPMESHEVLMDIDSAVTIDSLPSGSCQDLFIRSWSATKLHTLCTVKSLDVFYIPKSNQLE